MRNYGISAISLWPHSLGPQGPQTSITMAKEAGYDGIQALPMKGWDYSRINEWSEGVISFEDAWLVGPLWQVCLRELGILGEPAPRLVDWLLFGQKRFPKLPNAIESAHDLRSPSAVAEIAPAFWQDRSEILEYCAQGGLVCWDTFHVRDPLDSEEKPFGDWRDLLDKLPEGAIGLIHVHVVKNELSQFLSGAESELTEMLIVLGEKTQASVIVEVFPPLRTYSKTVKFAAKMLQITNGWLG